MFPPLGEGGCPICNAGNITDNKSIVENLDCLQNTIFILNFALFKKDSMYAVVFDIDTNCLNANYHGNSYNNAYGDIRKFMEANGFDWQQGSVYFGTPTIDAVKCVLTIQKLSQTYPWFSSCVKDIRMLRIEENNDLLPAIGF